MNLKRWKKLSEKTVVKNSHWSYNLDEFEIEGRTKGEYHYVHTLGSTMVVPFLSESEIVLVKQFRYLNQRESIEFPCGSIEKGFNKLENALKELREETGYSAELEFVGEFSPYTGASDEMCSVYLGKKLKHSPLPQDLTEDCKSIILKIDEFEDLIKQNKIWDGLTLSAWLLVKNYISF